MTELRRKVVKLIDREGGQVRRTLLFNRLWRERRRLLERALAFLEADDFIGTGKLRQSQRGPKTQYFWLTDKGKGLVIELNHPPSGRLFDLKNKEG